MQTARYFAPEALHMPFIDAPDFFVWAAIQKHAQNPVDAVQP